MLKFAANLSTLFTEVEITKRFQLAKENGFAYVEMQSPYEVEPDILQKAILENGLQFILFNSYEGDGYEMKCPSVPGLEILFCKNISKSLVYSTKLGYPKLHILSGYRDPEFAEEEQEQCLINNLKSAALILEEHEIIGLIEPICDEIKPNYFLNSYEKASRILKNVDHPNIKLLIDLFHLQKIEGSIENLEKYYDLQGHLQISQDPGRREPFYPGGRIDFSKVFDVLEKKNHPDAIGLEYYPSGTTTDSLEWMKKYNNTSV